ncbi:hypothetical protein C6P45_001766 [Maudiozyma exigua]|uniref:Uncharacterized protein n=1 Tax=Maudiozyma exigua TaxID=34358 RepID=A0A9P6VZQ7_MAUEX|nr:hypothetical protein C6P45_001766 [Kazachstania exigua]
MLGSLQEFTKSFFYDSQDHKRKEPYELYKNKRTKRGSPKYQSIRANNRRNRVLKPANNSPIFNTRLSRDIHERSQYDQVGDTASRVRLPSRLNKMKNYLMSIFSNDTETIDSMKESCHNINIRRRNTNFNTNNSYLNIRQRIENSEAFRSKLSELKYDKEQLHNLRRSAYGNPVVASNENIPHKNLDEDKVFLLRNENRLLKRDLKAKKAELDVTKQRLALALEKNRKYSKNINELKIQLNDYKLENDKISIPNDTLYNPPALRKPHEGQFSRTTDEMKYNNMTDLKNVDNVSDSISPVRIDFSRYSDNSDTTNRVYR